MYGTLPSNDTICPSNKQIHCTKVSVIGNYKPFMNIWVAVIKLESTASVLQCLEDKILLFVLVTRCLQLGLEIRCFWQPPQKVGIISMLNTQQHDRLHTRKLSTPDNVLLTVYSIRLLPVWLRVFYVLCVWIMIMMRTTIMY